MHQIPCYIRYRSIRLCVKEQMNMCVDHAHREIHNKPMQLYIWNAPFGLPAKYLETRFDILSLYDSIYFQGDCSHKYLQAFK